MLLNRFERQADRVDAPSLVRRYVVALTLEDVAEVRTAVGALGFGAHHAHRSIFDELDGVVLGGGVERRPAAVAGELGVGAEELLAAGSASVDAGGGCVGVLAGKGWLGATLAEHCVLLWRELGAPLGV